MEIKATVKITKQNIDLGLLTHVGWTLGRAVAEDCGANVYDYFDATGKFLGEDDNGLAPTFSNCFQVTE